MESRKIITTSETKIAIFNFENNEMKLNDVVIQISESVFRKDRDRIIYVPISEMGIVYNIQIEYIESTNRVSVEDLNRAMIVANVSRDTPLRFRPRTLSRGVEDLRQGQRIRGFHLTASGWRQIKTDDGQVRFCKRK